MNKHLEEVAKSYDEAIDLGKQGINRYESLPDYITKDPDFVLYKKCLETDNTQEDSIQIIRNFLEPNQHKRFVDMGCCLNYMFRGYDQWPSLYYGVDISPKTIQLLQEVSVKRNKAVGALVCESMHKTSFEDNYFHIGQCIGSLEYFESEFVEQCLAEFYRVLKPKGRFILDIPRQDSPESRIAMMIEDYLGRTDQFSLSEAQFEKILSRYFHVEKKEACGPMKLYYLTRLD